MKTGRKLTEIDPAGVAVLLGLTVGLGIAVHESFFLVAAMITLGVVMKTPIILLLTNDPKLEDCVAHVLRQSGGLSHLAHSADDALQIVCGTGRELDLAVIDFESGPHGMTLLSTMSMR